MEECPVCKHGMLMIEKQPDGSRLFRCPKCKYLKLQPPIIKKDALQAGKPCFYGVGQYVKTTTNRVKGVVSKKGGR